ncbi:MAG: nucleotidyl transferase AbiEii/AbiGii toxin family protein [Dehalogenimonas sp.]|jgi:predicted nucleotidyltransferase component of viral defense system|uniref:Nucleotidyl transferase AbiEii/AbiGii toxin family protein n=1 Tax=Candidatus Dehalogenimonas loeffleri TaxID=3127115 RepID=A0ABZ2J373_9CHLR|nr:nucleotidyl transferase AbiEii/AbiGii toxin family protein [Dehalogenimonas sp.]
MKSNIAVSIQARLLTIARERGEEFNLLLTRYAMERFLYRLSVSEAGNRYLLKGALLFSLWFDSPHRPTRDIDLLEIGMANETYTISAIKEICRVRAADGIRFDPDSISVEQIREDDVYGGLRVKINGRLGNTRCNVQVDIGFGDAVTPGPEEIDFPVILAEQPVIKLRAYPRSTMIAEKLEAIVSLGMANSRVKDYYDLFALAGEDLPPESIAEAIVATFNRRRTPLPEDTPLGLSDEFAGDDGKRAMWSAFRSRNRIAAPELGHVVNGIRSFVTEPLRLAREQRH